jgi:hypothetical protein
MAYSNGYDQSAVITALATRLGFRQPLGSGVPTLTSGVKTTDSGRYYQDFHALVTVNNIKSVMEQSAASDSDLNTYLDDLEKAAIMRALNGVFNGPEVIQQTRLFTRYGLNDQLITNSGLFVGHEIDVAGVFDIGVQLDAVYLFLNGAATFNIYLFKDGKVTSEWTQSVTTIANEILTVTLTDRVLKQGKYYLGYFQNDLGSVKAYQEQTKRWNNGYLFNARPVQMNASGVVLDKNTRSYPFPPYGINADISTFKDHTEQIKKKAAQFDELIGLQMAYMVIEQVIYTTRSDKEERILKDQLTQIGIQFDLNGAAPITDSPQIIGLKQRIDRETKKVKEAFYPKNKSQSVNLAEC